MVEIGHAVRRRAKAKVGAAGFAAVAVLVTACGGSDNNSPASVENAGAAGVSAGSSGALTSEECSQQTTIYQTAHILGGADSRGTVFPDVDSMLRLTKLMDGKEGSGGQVQVALTDEQKSEVWANYLRATEGFDPSEYNLTRGQLVVYGDVTGDAGAYDGKLDANAKLCVVIKTLDGSVSAS